VHRTAVCIAVLPDNIAVLSIENLHIIIIKSGLEESCLEMKQGISRPLEEAIERRERSIGLVHSAVEY